MNEQEKPEVKQEEEAISFTEFLESNPPSSFTNIGKLISDVRSLTGKFMGCNLLTPEIQIHCPKDTCNGTRFFRCTTRPPEISRETYTYCYLSYVCSNCQKTVKTFSLATQCDQNADSGICYKFGELPVYGPPTPARLITLIGPDREVFLKGRRCENQGLGIGAFVYYRRVVENQKNRILDEIIKVSKKLKVPTDQINILETAKTETQFSKALSSVKDAIPQTLLINGQNPLTLLHSALSDGLHEKTDDECLDIAHSVRVVLSELSERLAQALKDEKELNHALSKLMNVKKKNN